MCSVGCTPFQSILPAVAGGLARNLLTLNDGEKHYIVPQQTTERCCQSAEPHLPGASGCRFGGMRSQRFDLERIRAAFAQAAIDSTKWPTATDRIAGATGSFGAALFPVMDHLPEAPFSRSMA